MVVRIGKDDNNKTLNNMTTTKITIDMSPKEEFPKEIFGAIKLPRAMLHNLKSTPLVINTIPKENDLIQNLPERQESENDKTKNHQLKSTPIITNLKNNPKSNCNIQLAILKKLYDEASEHSDDSEKANEEVRSLMSNGLDNDFEEKSVVSGSWSKMKAFRAVKYLNGENFINKNQRNIKRGNNY